MRKFIFHFLIIAGSALGLCFFLFMSSVQKIDSASSAPAESTALSTIEGLQSGRLQAASVEDFLKLLPQSILSYHVFAYGSRSLQESSFEFPRAILFGGDGKEMVSFNGLPTQRGGERVEAIIFNEAQNNYRFFEVKFADNKAHIEENPAKCLACHGVEGKDAKPIWEAYPFWPGLYGSEDDCEYHVPEEAPNPGPCVKDSTEAQWFQKFMEGNRQKGRYALLPEQGYFPDTKGSQRPLLFISRALMGENTKRIVKNMSRAGLSSVRHLILYSLLCSPKECADVFPKEMRATFTDFVAKTSLRQTEDQLLGLEHRYRRMHDLMKGQAQSERLREQESHQGPEDYSVLTTMEGKKKYAEKYLTASIRQFQTFYPLMTILGQHPEQWSMTPPPRYFAWDTGQFLMEEFANAIMSEFFPELQSSGSSNQSGESSESEGGYATADLNYWYDHQDELLQKAKEEAQASLPRLRESLRQEIAHFETPWAREVRLARETLSRTCTRCHAEGTMEAPKIDFTNPELTFKSQSLAKKAMMRLQSTNPKYKMPRDEELTPAVKEALVRYIQALSGLKR